jgi:hypothetical protein
MMEAQTREPQMGLTFEKVWAMFQESDRRMREFQESQRKSQENIEREMRESRENAEREMLEFRKSQQETARQIKETDRQVKMTAESIGKLGNRFGELAEHLVVPNIMEKFNAQGYQFKGVAENQRITNEQGQTIAEIDILLENGSYCIAVEVKAKPQVTDIADFVRRLGVLRRYKDDNKDKRKIRGALAGAIFHQSVKDAVLKAGLYVVEQSGDTVKINIPEGFNPKEW